MLKQGTFVNKKFNIFLLGNIWGWLGYCINLMTDSLISGNQLGELSLQAVSIVFPLFSVISLFSYLVSPGASVIFGKRIGEFKQEEAYRVAGTALLSSIIIGIILATGLFLIKDPFLSYYSCTGKLYDEASAYYNWIILFALLSTIDATTDYFVVADGESVLLTVGGLSEIIVDIVLSVILSKVLGVAGVGIASCLGLTSKIIVFSMHFLRKTNNIKFKFCIDIKTVGSSIVVGFSRYIVYLFMAVVGIIMDKIIIDKCGLDYIPAYSVVNLVFSICILFGAINDAGVSFLTCFLGERNKCDINYVLRKTTKAMLLMSLFISLFFFFGAPLMPLIYGIETPAIGSTMINTSRIMAFTTLGYGSCYLCAEISCSLEKPLQAGFISFLADAFSPLFLSIIFGSLWGFYGIAIGMCLSTYLSFGIYALVSVLKNGKKDFPVYVGDFGEEGVSYDLIVTKESAIEIRDKICKELANRNFEVKNIGLLIEEFFTRVMEKNPDKKVLSECTLLFSEKRVRIIIRDDGVLFNYIDENNSVESINAHVLNSLVEQTKVKNYVLTTSFNRNGFVFERKV